MASSARRRFSVRHPVVVDVGCSCRRTKLASLFSAAPTKPKLNPQTPPKHHHPLSSYYPFSPSAATTTTTNFSTTTISPWETSHNASSSSTSPYEDSSSPSWTTTKPSVTTSTTLKKKKKKPPGSKAGGATGRLVKESVAVVKESDDPYHDFRDSMLQMILEKEIYAWDDLRELLHRFLSLNSPYHHDSILRAFTEIWNGVFSSTATSATSSSPSWFYKPTTPTTNRGGGSRRKQHTHHHRLSRDPMGYVA